MREAVKTHRHQKQRLIFDIVAAVAFIISLLSATILVYGVFVASNNGTLSDLGSTASTADALGVFTTTTSPPTSSPTVIITRQDGTMSLDAEFSALREFANDTNRSLESLAMDIIESALDLDIEDSLSVVIIIHDVRSGSIIIDYSLRVLDVEDADLLDVAASNLDAAVGSAVEIEGGLSNETLSFPVTSNAITAVTTTAAPTVEPTTSTTLEGHLGEGTASPTMTVTTTSSAAPTVSPSPSPSTAIPTTAAPTESDVIYREDIIYHHVHRTNMIHYNWTFEDGDVGPYDQFNRSDPVYHFAGNQYYGWGYGDWRTVQYQLDLNRTQDSSDINLPFGDLHVKYGDFVTFENVDSWSKDDLILVTEEMFHSCNFSTIADDKDDVTNESTELWMTDMYGLQNHLNDSEWEPFTFEIVDRRNETTWDSLRDELLAADILYFTSSRKWERDDTPTKRACKNGFKQRVVIEHDERRTLPVIESNINSLFDSEEVQDLVSASGYLGRTLILKQFHTENREVFLNTGHFEVEMTVVLLAPFKC